MLGLRQGGVFLTVWWIRMPRVWYEIIDFFSAIGFVRVIGYLKMVE